MGEQNDPMKNDELERVPEDTIQNLRLVSSIGIKGTVRFKSPFMKKMTMPDSQWYP